MLQACCFILNYNAILDSAPETDQYYLEPGLCIQFNRKCVRFTHYSKLWNSYRDGPSTNDNTYQRGKRNDMPIIVDVKAERLFTGTNDRFLNTTPDKETLIRLLSDQLCQNGCKVVQASGYADIDIVEAAVSLSLTKSTTLMDRIYIFWCFSFSTHKVFKIGSTSGLTNQKTTLYISYHCSEE